MMLPTEEECEKILDSHCTPSHVRRHSRRVTKVALAIGKKLLKKGEKIDLELLERAGLLHDVMKLADFKKLDLELFDPGDVTPEKIKAWTVQHDKFNNIGHEEIAFRIFKERYPEMARVIRRHRFAAIEHMQDECWPWEDRLLTYADKRVAHDRIVSLEERFSEGHMRYSGIAFDRKNPDVIDKLYFQLEKDIFSGLDISPDDIRYIVEACGNKTA